MKCVVQNPSEKHGTDVKNLLLNRAFIEFFFSFKVCLTAV